jgi:hypothetical protein
VSGILQVVAFGGEETVIGAIVDVPPVTVAV